MKPFNAYVENGYFINGYQNSGYGRRDAAAVAVGPFGGHSTLTVDLGGYWKMEESSGTRLGADGGMSLTVSGAVGSTSGKLGNAANLSAGNYLVGANSSLHPTTKCSVSFWYNGAPADPAAQIAKTGGYSGEGIVWVKNQGDGTSVATFNDGFVNVAGISTPAGTHHLALVYDGTQPTNAGKFKVWTDGVAQTLAFGASPGETIENNNDDWNVGAYDWAGWIDELGIWTKALSSQEVADLYNGGAGLTY